MDATKFFDDNLMRLGPNEAARAHADPMAMNLYTGLYNMAEQLTQIQSQLNDLSNQVQQALNR